MDTKVIQIPMIIYKVVILLKIKKNTLTGENNFTVNDYEVFQLDII
jgi:hypothetical protein